MWVPTLHRPISTEFQDSASQNVCLWYRMARKGVSTHVVCLAVVVLLSRRRDSIARRIEAAMAKLGDKIALVLVLVMVMAVSAESHVNSVRRIRDWEAESERLLSDLFAEWAHQHGRDYGASVEERHRRFLVWQDNLRYIQHHAEKNASYSLGLTKFADLTNAEFRRLYTGTRVDRSRALRRRTGFRYADIDAPESVDWRTKGAVTSVKDQGACGEAFSDFPP